MEFMQKDRDMIQAHNIKLSVVCKSLDKMDIKLDKLDEKMDDNVKNYITKKMFMWANGIIIALVISLFGYTHVIDKQVVENTVRIEKTKQTPYVK